jgi:hypothetical protein
MLTAGHVKIIITNMVLACHQMAILTMMMPTAVERAADHNADTSQPAYFGAASR